MATCEIVRTEVNVEQPLPALLAGMSGETSQWARDANLESCVEYAKRSKYVTIPPEYGDLI